MTAVFIQPIGYPRFCRLTVIGTKRHATACLAYIAAYEPVLITADRPAEMCSACREDLRVREARGEDLTLWHEQIGIRAELTVERAAEELFGPLPTAARTVTPRERPQLTVDPAEAFDEYGPDSAAIRAVLEHEDLLGDGET